MIVARVVACVFAVLAIFAAFGWLLDQDASHAVGFVAAAVLAFVLSTIPVGRVP
jgi:hypothetical protein